MNTVADKCGGVDVRQQEHRKWSGGKSEIVVIERGGRLYEGVGKIKSSLSGE